MTDLYIGNDMLIDLSDLTNESTDKLVGTATVQVTLRDSGGATVAGATWPLTMSPTSARGQFRGTLPAGLSLTDGADYVARVTVTGGGLPTGRWDLPARARLRAS